MIDHDCPQCGGEGTPLGSLGRLQWFRCRQCGLDFPHEEKPRKVRRERDDQEVRAP